MAHRATRAAGREAGRDRPGDIDVFFFTNGGAEANENAIKLARQVTGRQKILARYRSYHGATGQVIAATGDPRRWAAETGVCGHRARPRLPAVGTPDRARSTEQACATTEDVIMYEGPQTIAAFILEPVVGTNGILIPPDGYMQGIREHVRQVRHPAHRRRGHDRLRPHRRVVGGRPLGRRAGPASRWPRA